MENKKNIKRFFECLIPVTVCNLKCNYCYVIQRNDRNMELAKLKYTPKHIGKCLTQKRLGGICYFSICGAGETLTQPEIIDIVNEILSQGHFVNITTNGTLKNKFTKFSKFSKENLSRLHFSFSFHYLELKRLNLLETFFNNIKYVHELGCSYMVQINLCDEYIPYLDEIKQLCLDNVGALPQVAATRKESPGLIKIELHTNLSVDEYKKIGESFDSPLFKYTMKNLNVKRKEFCYAGERSGVLNLATGYLGKCYNDSFPQNIFKDPNSEIKFEAIGNNCLSSFCFNSSHFMSLGVIDNDEEETYCSLRDREGANWFNDTTKEFLSHKLSENNNKYSDKQKKVINLKMKNKVILGKVKHKIGDIVRNR